MSLVSRVEALASPNLSKRATPKAPRMCTYIESTLDIEQWNRSKPIRAVYNTPHEAFCIALFLTNCVVNCQIPTRQNQSVQKRLISYVCLSNLCQLRLSILDADVQRYNIFLLYDSKSQKTNRFAR